MSKSISVDNLLVTLEVFRDEFLRDSPSARMLCDTLEREIKHRLDKGELHHNDKITTFE